MPQILIMALWFAKHENQCHKKNIYNQQAKKRKPGIRFRGLLLAKAEERLSSCLLLKGTWTESPCCLSWAWSCGLEVVIDLFPPQDIVPTRPFLFGSCTFGRHAILFPSARNAIDLDYLILLHHKALNPSYTNHAVKSTVLFYHVPMTYLKYPLFTEHSTDHVEIIVSNLNFNLSFPMLANNSFRTFNFHTCFLMLTNISFRIYDFPYYHHNL